MDNVRISLFVLIKEHAALIYSILLLCIITFILLVISVHMNDGRVVYSYDDAYIHMSMAKTFAKYGIWGINQYGFTSSSSSLVWTSLLAFIYFVTGTNEITPLLLNIFISIIIIISVYFIFKKESIKPSYIMASLAALIILTPLPPLILTGLEHPLHVYVSILFIYVATSLITGKRKGYINSFWLVILSTILPSIRYEGLVLVIVTALLLLIRKQWKLSLLMVVLSVLPIYVFGIISIKKGWSFFPNSLLLKGDFRDVMTFSDFLNEVITQWTKVLSNIGIVIALIIIALILAFSLLYYKKHRKYSMLGNEDIVLLSLLGINIILYLLFSRTGWSYRYQSFLVALGIFVFSIIMFKNLSVRFNNFILLRSKVEVFLFFLILSALGGYFSYGGIMTITQAPRMTTNIYEQQYQMAMFLHRYYENKTIALNDIGASNYFAHIKCVDLWGLADLEISQKRRNHTYTASDIREIARIRGIDIAIVYDSWFSEDDSSILPKEWIKIGEWKILNNIIAGDDIISFYALGAKNADILINTLKSFSGDLPGSVTQSGKYTEQL